MLKSKAAWVGGAALVLCLCAGGLIVACGDDKTPSASVNLKAPDAPIAAAPAETPAKAVMAAAPAVAVRAGSIAGNVKAKDPKKRKKIKMDADPKCAAMHAEPPLMEDIVVDADGNCQWAFVYVKKGAEGKKPSSPPPPAVINQVGCHYEPHVLGIVVGADLTVKNSDDLLHNIHALPFNNKEFNFGQPTKGLEEKKQFQQQEIMVKVKCDVHPWMGAWIGVLEHGFFSVTDEKGNYGIPEGLGDGKYTVECWHEGYKSVSAEVEVKGGKATQNFQLVDKKE